MTAIPRYPGEGGATKIFWNKGEHPLVQAQASPNIAYDLPMEGGPTRSNASLMRSPIPDAPTVV